jgi:putative transposase
MPQPRHTQIDIHATPYYHCISRCVRRAFLCGHDRATGRSFDHRKPWLLDQLATLTDIFAVDLCAYAILSNHYHLVARLDWERAAAWSDAEVGARYGRLFPETAAARLALPAVPAAAWIARWRARLSDLSWFMRCLNEAIARRANAEDACSGRFWEGRFRSQALLDAAGVLTCMAYVDLNPVRAGLATDLCDCEFTSIQQRLQEAPAAAPGPADPAPPAVVSAPPPAAPRRPRVLPFAGLMAAGAGGEDPLPLDLAAYVELLTATGACLRGVEPTARLPDASCALLASLGIVSAHWLECLQQYSRRFFTMVGAVHSIDVYCARTDRDHAKGRTWAARAFRPAA